ncbi:MAG: hypothetical protein M1541_21480 [Acidobacteria bacterium]|nr:hypothetical protein [Acidobacteriota bacterium]
MIEALSPSSETFLADLNRVQRRLDAAQRQISSGLKVSAPSDDPDSISSILQLHAELERNSQIRTNVTRTKAEVDTADSTVQQAIQALERVQTLGAQAAGSMQDETSRLAIDNEVESLQDQIIGLSQTAVQGRSLFSDALDASREIEDPAGGSFPVARTLQQVFDPRNPDGTPTTDNVFASIASLRAELQANNPDGIQTALESLKSAHEHLNQELGYYGAAQNRISNALDYAGKHEVELKTALSNLQDADLTAAILELNQTSTQQQAALSAQAKRPTSTLFDYLG